MKNMIIILVVLVLVLVGSGVFAARSFLRSNSGPTPTPTPVGIQIGNVPENTEVEVTVEKSTAKENTILVKAAKLNNNYTGVAYEITYETSGSLQGVNSGTKPIDITGKSDYEKDVYLGTCSRNVCKPHTGVTSVSVVLQFINKNGQQSKVSKDFPL